MLFCVFPLYSWNSSELVCWTAEDLYL